VPSGARRSIRNHALIRAALGSYVSAHPIITDLASDLRMTINNTALDFGVELQRIYDGEINIRIGWLRNGGIDIRLGDDLNGYLAVETVGTVAKIVPWLPEAIAHFYPESSYRPNRNR
jgi:hypothetical protein